MLTSDEKNPTPYESFTDVLKQWLSLKVRMKLNSLTQAFSQRSEESAASHSVHKLTLGVFALNNALEAGHPTSRHRDLLRSSCDKDPLVSLAVDSLPESTDSQVRLDLHSAQKHVYFPHFHAIFKVSALNYRH